MSGGAPSVLIMDEGGGKYVEKLTVSIEGVPRIVPEIMASVSCKVQALHTGNVATVYRAERQAA